MKLSNLTLISLMLVSITFSSGCAVMKASNAPAKKDLIVLSEGTPRAHVHASLGAPISSTEDNGVLTEAFQFPQGYSAGVRAGKVFIYLIADLGTLALAEIITNPIETAFHKREISLTVDYDTSGNVSGYHVIKGKSAVDGMMSTI